MKSRIDRREAIRRLALFSTTAVASNWLFACKSKPSCSEAIGLSTDDLNARNNTAAYVEHSPNPAKTCNGCVHYLPGAPNACGGCKVVKGPVDPEAYCRLWMATPT